MFKNMTDNDLSYHAGASEHALIAADEDLPVVMVVDQCRIEVYWTDNELDTHNFYNISPLALRIGEMIGAGIKAWLWKGIDPVEIQKMLDAVLPAMGFTKI